MSYLKEAHARLIAELVKNTPPTFVMFNPADVFDHDAADHIQRFASAVNDYICSFVRELESHGISISPKEFLSPLSDTADDIVGELNNHAYQVREDTLEAEVA